MSKYLYDELIDKEFVAVETIDKELPPDSLILYISNKSNQDSRITLVPITIEQTFLENQNPSLKIEDSSASFCLSSLEETPSIGCDPEILKSNTTEIIPAGLYHLQWVVESIVGDIPWTDWEVQSFTLDRDMLPNEALDFITETILSRFPSIIEASSTQLGNYYKSETGTYIPFTANTPEEVFDFSLRYVITGTPLDIYSKIFQGENANARLISCKRSLSPSVIPPPPDEGQIGEGEMTDDGWSLITFDNMNAVNPSYTVSVPLVGDVDVTTHACFIGQNISQISGISSYTIQGNPVIGTPLQFNTDHGFYVQIKEDGANPTSPVLAGSIGYDSPVSVLFSKDVHAVGLTGGYFNEIGSTYIEVYDRLGNVLGSALNTSEGIETFGFSVGSVAKIAGFSFYVNSLESAGFALDNLRFK